ncbi:alpha/beta fold hydrolase [Saccharothrix sp. DSM 118769]
MAQVVVTTLLGAEGVRPPVREPGPGTAPAPAVPAPARSCRDQAPDLPGEPARRPIGAVPRVPPRVRRGPFRRDVGGTAVWKGPDEPTLVVHGTADEVVDPAAGEHAAALIPGADLRRYDRTGHAPSPHRPERLADDPAGPVAGVAR